MKCQRKICHAEATHGVCIRVPILGMPLQEHTPLSMLINVCLCEIHIKEADARYFFRNDPRLCVVAKRTLKDKDPDFARAYVEGCDLASPVWALFVKINEDDKPTPPASDPSRN